MSDDTITVFISYSHDTPQHEASVLELADRLRADGIDAMIDQYQDAPPEGWQLWMEKQIRDAKFVLVVCTEMYHRRVMNEQKPGTGLGVRWEATIAYQQLYNEGGANKKFIPILFDRIDKKHIPGPLQPTTHYFIGDAAGYESLYRRLTNQPATPAAPLGKLHALGSRNRAIADSSIPPTTTQVFIVPSEDQLPTTVRQPDLYDTMKKIRRSLGEGATFAWPQGRRSRKLVQMIANRLHIKDPMEESTFTYEDFFSRYFSKLNDREKLEFAEIRSTTDTLYENHRRIRELIDACPQVLDEIPELCNLQDHIKFWDKKYENIFSQRRNMCVIFTGQSDGVPFPKGLYEALDKWFDSHKPIT